MTKSRGVRATLAAAAIVLVAAGGVTTAAAVRSSQRGMLTAIDLPPGASPVFGRGSAGRWQYLGLGRRVIYFKLRGKGLPAFRRRPARM
jgi:hypothetical protein